MFITLEGPDGSGKSTQSKMLVDKLRNSGYDVELVHFPRYEGVIGGLIGEIIRGEKQIKNFDALEMLYVADQLDFQKDLEDLIYNQHKIVVADRYDMSTIAYYASKTGCSVNEAMTLIRQKWQYNFMQPDATFLMAFNGDIDDRRRGSNKEKDLFEVDSAVLNTINDVYLELSEKLYTRYVVTLDDINTAEENSNIIFQEINSILDDLKKYSFKNLSSGKNKKIEPF